MRPWARLRVPAIMRELPQLARPHPRHCPRPHHQRTRQRHAPTSMPFKASRACVQMAWDVLRPQLRGGSFVERVPVRSLRIPAPKTASLNENVLFHHSTGRPYADRTSPMSQSLEIVSDPPRPGAIDGAIVRLTSSPPIYIESAGLCIASCASRSPRCGQTCRASRSRSRLLDRPGQIAAASGDPVSGIDTSTSPPDLSS